jgi:hypothetical protein
VCCAPSRLSARSPIDNAAFVVQGGTITAVGRETYMQDLAEAGIPCQALRIDDHVVRLARPRRQVVLGIDHLRGTAFRARQNLEAVGPLRRRAQVHRGQILGLQAAHHAFHGALLCGGDGAGERHGVLTIGGI